MDAQASALAALTRTHTLTHSRRDAAASRRKLNETFHQKLKSNYECVSVLCSLQLQNNYMGIRSFTHMAHTDVLAFNSLER